jgi:hypothetical protein
MKYRIRTFVSVLSLSLLATFLSTNAGAIELLHSACDEVNQVDVDGPFTTPDSSGRNNAGTLMSMDNTNLVPGRVGNALRFDGGTSAATRDRVEIPTADVAVLTDFNRTYTQFTFAAFLKPLNIAADEPDTTFFAGKLGNSPQRGWQAGLVGTDPPTFAHPDEIVTSMFEGPLGTDNDNEYYSGPTAAIANDQWFHFAFTFSSTTESSSFFRMYINGQRIVDAPTDLTQMNGINTRAFQIGNRGDSRADGWSGLIDEVHLFDHVLTDEEIVALIPPPQVFSAGDFDEDTDVDGADFLLWQQTLGNTVALGTGADGNSNGMIDAGDLAVWRTEFGPVGGSSSIPEPSAVALLLAAGFCVRCRRRPRRLL